MHAFPKKHKMKKPPPTLIEQTAVCLSFLAWCLDSCDLSPVWAFTECPTCHCQRRAFRYRPNGSLLLEYCSNCACFAINFDNPIFTPLFNTDPIRFDSSAALYSNPLSESLRHLLSRVVTNSHSRRSL